jgi:hypothetical protein
LNVGANVRKTFEAFPAGNSERKEKAQMTTFIVVRVLIVLGDIIIFGQD